jgi:TolA-binding protein
MENPGSVFIDCSTCGADFHTECIAMSSTSFDFFSSHKLAWNCVICQSKSISKLQELNELVDNIKTDVKEVDNKIDKFQNTLSTFQQEYDAKLDELKSELTTKLEEEHLVSERKLATHDEIIEKVVADMNHMEVMSKMTNLLITNVPQSKDENLLDIVEKISGNTDATYEAGDVEDVYRIKSLKSSNNYPPMIVVKFKSTQKRQDFYNHYLNLVRPNKKRPEKITRQIKARDIGLESDNTIFIKEHLSRLNKTIYDQALKLKSNGKLSKMSTSFGYVRVNLNDGSWQTVNNMNQLLSITGGF